MFLTLLSHVLTYPCDHHFTNEETKIDEFHNFSVTLDRAGWVVKIDANPDMSKAKCGYL